MKILIFGYIVRYNGIKHFCTAGQILPCWPEFDTQAEKIHKQPEKVSYLVLLSSPINKVAVQVKLAHTCLFFNIVDHIFSISECLSDFVNETTKKRDRMMSVRGQGSLSVDLPLLAVVLTGSTKPRPLAALQCPRLACNDREAFH